MLLCALLHQDTSLAISLAIPVEPSKDLHSEAGFGRMEDKVGGFLFDFVFTPNQLPSQGHSSVQKKRGQQH